MNKEPPLLKVLKEFGSYEGYFPFDESVTLNLQANTAQTITLYVYSHGQGAGSDFFYDSHTFIDPYIEIDPAFQYRDQYRLVFSEGITHPVPEPATLFLIGSGFIGLAGLRKKFKARS